ncbi:MAG: carboxy-S-adenosyl-L-methionine synthase CmoA [bacterium]
MKGFAMVSDELFREKRNFINDFDFGEKTAQVFDDMLSRSVPFYAEIQCMIGELTEYFAVDHTNLYDLGCSTGETLITLYKKIFDKVRFIGIDSSYEMLNKARMKFEEANICNKIELVQSDLNQGVCIENASVVIMTLTLQFIRPLFREKLVKMIADGINAGGCLIVVEKVLSPNSLINRLFIKLYYDFKKRSGYNELEIQQKREALENILIPYHYDENRRLFVSNGFTDCDCFFRWYNFCGMIAIK